MEVETEFGIVRQADRTIPEKTIISGTCFRSLGRKKIDLLIGGNQDIIAPMEIAHMDKRTIGTIISLSSLIERKAGPEEGPQTVIRLSRIEYRDVNPTLIRDSMVKGKLFCMFIADSMIMSLE